MSNIIQQNRIAYQIDSIGSISNEPIQGNAPVTRVLWQCDNLPNGLTLSTDGKLSGRPTTIGNYACSVTVTTNWGTASKTINIRVTE